MLAEGVSAQGYVFQIEMTLRAVGHGAVVREVPIVFRDRELGRSKMSSDVVREAVVRVAALRFGRALSRGPRLASRPVPRT